MPVNLISPAAVSEMVHRLERDGLLRLDERKEVRLTERGLVKFESGQMLVAAV